MDWEDPFDWDFDLPDWDPSWDGPEPPFDGWPTLDDLGDLVDDPDWPVWPSEADDWFIDLTPSPWPKPPVPPGSLPTPPLPPSPVKPPPAVAVTAATWAAIGVLVIEIVLITDAIVAVTDKQELQSMIDNLIQMRARAVQLGTWDDAQQAQWAKANEAAARKADQLQRDLENSWLGWLIY